MNLLDEARGQTVPHLPVHEFQCRTGDRLVGRFFSTRLPLEGRSERGALVGVLVGRNGGRQKISPKKVFDDGCGLPGLTTWRNPNPSIFKLFYGYDTMLRENEYSDSH